MSEKTIRIYWKRLGGHTHMRVFSGDLGRTLGKAGDLVMTNEEFDAWRFGRHAIEFIEEPA